MDLCTHYRRIIAERGFVFDPAQAEAMAHLQTLGEHLLATPAPRSGRWAWFAAKFAATPPGINGLYLWGDVGRGKTWLMDLFFEQLPVAQKLRLHFHHFLQDIHDELARLRRQRNPLHTVAGHYARRARVLCLDECYVEDISDAMILHHLLDAMLAQGITLVLTANQPPEGLYHNGLQRERFLPAIALLKRHCHVLQLNGDSDHRLRRLQQAATYFTPVDTASEQHLRERFAELCPRAGVAELPVTIHHRQIASRLCADDVVWFDFHQLCFGPRSGPDYREIARRFHTVLVSGVPVLGEQEDAAAHRFIDMVDEFYDRKVKLIVSAAAEPESLYTGRRLGFEFRRTASRLREMRSHDYLALPHHP
jgi:cell division protein ZapE